MRYINANMPAGIKGVMQNIHKAFLSSDNLNINRIKGNT